MYFFFIISYNCNFFFFFFFFFTLITQLHIYIYIYIYAFSRRFYPKRLTLHSSYSFYILSALAFPGNRTHDIGVASAMLYQLSYRKPVESGTPDWVGRMKSLGWTTFVNKIWKRIKTECAHWDWMMNWFLDFVLIWNDFPEDLLLRNRWLVDFPLQSFEDRIWDHVSFIWCELGICLGGRSLP